MNFTDNVLWVPTVTRNVSIQYIEYNFIDKNVDLWNSATTKLKIGQVSVKAYTKMLHPYSTEVANYFPFVRHQCNFCIIWMQLFFSLNHDRFLTNFQLHGSRIRIYDSKKVEQLEKKSVLGLSIYKNLCAKPSWYI